MEKKLWQSKTFWVNVIALIAMAVEAATGSTQVGVEEQGAALAIVNLILRLVTKEPVALR